MRRSLFAAFICLLTIMAGVLIAADSAKSPEELFKSKGLIKTGFMLIVPQEQALHDAVATLRTAKAKLAAGAAKLRDADAQIKAAERNLKSMEAEDHDLNVRLANGARDNQTIGRHNLLLDQIKDQLTKIVDLTEAKDKLLVSRSDYITAALDASDKADAALHAYDAPHADKELAAAIDQYNLTAKPKVKLGPSAYFNEDLALVKQCKADVTSGIIPITAEGGVPNVEVLLNGAITQTMIWDSGCTGVCLSAKTAASLGLRESKDDEIVEATIADGSHVKEHIKVLDSIRIGPYTVEHVPCTIAPKGSAGADLLGNEFQHHFQFKLDVNGGTLQLTPLDAQIVTVKTPTESEPKLAPVAVRSSGAVVVKFSTGDTELDTVKAATRIFLNKKFAFAELPSELGGLTFTRRLIDKPPSDVIIIAPAHSKVYLIVDSDKGTSKEWDGVRELNQSLSNSNWDRLEDVRETGMRSIHAIYSQEFPAEKKIALPGTGNGIIVAAEKLEMGSGLTGASTKPDSSKLINRFAGVWFLPKNRVEYKLNADGTASYHDGNTGTWTVNESGTVINLQWANGGWSEVFSPHYSLSRNLLDAFWIFV